MSINSSRRLIITLEYYFSFNISTKNLFFFGKKFAFVKRGLHCQIYSTFSLHFICWKYFDKCFMDKNLHHISLTKFNKLNKRKKTLLLNNSVYLGFILSLHFQYIFTLPLAGRLICTCFRTFFLTRGQNNVL